MRGTGRKRDGRRALVWDTWNTASVIAARSLVRQGFTVDALLPRGVPWLHHRAFDGERHVIDSADDPQVEQRVFTHPLDAVFFHGDAQMRWLLERWDRLPGRLRRHLPPREALRVALSKQRSLEVAGALGLPLLPTRTCGSEAALEAALALEPRGAQVVVKGETGSAGRTVRAVRADPGRAAGLWAALGESGQVLVQRRIEGPRLLATVVFERGVQRAGVQHLKTLAFPVQFGITARGVTVRVREVEGWVDSLFSRLGWHGVANVEFRQDVRDGRWYFMEINPRVPSSIGIQKAAGVDVAAIWADVCAGEGGRHDGRQDYRLGQSYTWSVPTLAAVLRQPWRLPRALFSFVRGSDLPELEPGVAVRALRVAAWQALRA